MHVWLQTSGNGGRKTARRRLQSSGVDSVGSFCLQVSLGESSFNVSRQPLRHAPEVYICPQIIVGIYVKVRQGELGKIFKYRGPERSGSANETARFTGFIVILILSVPSPEHQSLTGRCAWDWQGGRGIAHPQLQVRAGVCWRFASRRLD